MDFIYTLVDFSGLVAIAVIIGTTMIGCGVLTVAVIEELFSSFNNSEESNEDMQR